MDKDYIKNIIQVVLNKEFVNNQKRKINDYDSDSTALVLIVRTLLKTCMLRDLIYT